jgi:hypothetical protein
MRALTYRLPHANWQLKVTTDVLKVLDAHVQRGRSSREAVGQLFSRDLTQDVIEVGLATVLAPSFAAFARVVLDPAKAGWEREQLFAKGWHCVGLWHTHPEPEPHPSSDDWALAKDHATAARPQRTGLVFAILGNRAPPAGLRIWVHDGHEGHQLVCKQALRWKLKYEGQPAAPSRKRLSPIRVRIRSLFKRAGSP